MLFRITSNIPLDLAFADFLRNFANGRSLKILNGILIVFYICLQTERFLLQCYFFQSNLNQIQYTVYFSKQKIYKINKATGLENFGLLLKFLFLVQYLFCWIPHWILPFKDRQPHINQRVHLKMTTPTANLSEIQNDFHNRKRETRSISASSINIFIFLVQKSIFPI